MKNEQLIHEALDAFWEVVAKRFPEATTGDLCPLTALAFDQAAEAAVTGVDRQQRAEPTGRKRRVIFQKPMRWQMMRRQNRRRFWLCPLCLTCA